MGVRIDQPGQNELASQSVSRGLGPEKLADTRLVSHVEDAISPDRDSAGPGLSRVRGVDLPVREDGICLGGRCMRVAQRGSQYQAKEQDEGRGPVILHVSINPRL
jgi:hypothetical protein